MAPHSPSPRSSSFLPSFRLRPQWAARNGTPPAQTPVNARVDFDESPEDHHGQLNGEHHGHDEESGIGDESLDGEENEEGEGEEDEGDEEDEEGAIEEGVYFSCFSVHTSSHSSRVTDACPTGWKTERLALHTDVLAHGLYQYFNILLKSSSKPSLPSNVPDSELQWLENFLLTVLFEKCLWRLTLPSTLRLSD